MLRPKGQTMTDNPNAQLLLDSLNALNAGDTDSCLERIHPSLLINLAGVPQQLVGRDVWLAGVEVLRAGFPDVRIDVEDIFGEGDRVAIRNTIRGTHLGEFQGIAATGRRIEVMSNEIYRIEHGMVVEEWVVTDNATLFAQITG
jgi:predicted ester cyclase